MRRRFAGLQETNSGNGIQAGIFLVRVQKAQYRWNAQKPFYILTLAVIEPKELSGQKISGRLYCTRTKKV